MGEVYRAHDPRVGRDVALKTLPPSLAQTDERRARFEREARLLAAVNHPNIVNLYSVEEADGVLFFTMELVAGRPLSECIPEGGLEVARAVAIAIPIAAALAAAHGRGIVHRDLKPANVMVLADESVKVLDFGVAKTWAPADASAPAPTHTATLGGVLVGTPDYMSPEQVQGQDVDARSDLFAFGVILYELLTGRRPFEGSSPAATMSAILRDEPPPLASIRSDVPQSLARIVHRCLEKHPARRTQSAIDVVHDLEDVRDDLQRTTPPVPVTTAPASWRARFRAATLSGAIAVVLAAGAVYAVVAWRHGRGAGPAAAVSSLAVLPLDNLSGDPQQDLFAEGMTEQLITDLAQLRSLRVISRTSVMRFKGSRLPVADIARQLDVDAVIEGSVMRAGSRIRVTAQLIGTRPERHLWARSYERDVQDVLALQSEIARAVAGEVHLELTASERERLGGRPSVNREAFEAYLRGRTMLERGGQGAPARAELERAVQLDPSYAPPYAVLADYWAFGLPARESMERARAAATTALRLDESLAEAHAALGLVYLYYDWSLPAAEKEFRRALDLSPGSAYVLGRYVEYCWAAGLTAEAIQIAQRARSIDPLNVVVQRDLGRSYYFDRQFARAVEEFRRQAGQNPGNRLVFMFYGIASELAGDQATAVEAIAHATELAGNSGTASRLREAFATRGYSAFLEAWGEATEGYVARGEGQAASAAMIYARAGRKDKAFAWLEKSFEMRSRALVLLQTEPQFDSLRGDPRFSDLIRRVGIARP